MGGNIPFQYISGFPRASTAYVDNDINFARRPCLLLSKRKTFYKVVNNAL